MLDLAAFRVRYPEFAQSLDATVQAALDDAEAETDAEVFGTKTNQAHGALAAHKLQSSPRGRETRLKPQPGSDSTSVYLKERRRLETLCCAGRGAL
jgi:hypothetical protein